MAPPLFLLVDEGGWGRSYAGEIEEDIVLDGAVDLWHAVDLDGRVGQEIGGESLLAGGRGDVHGADGDDAVGEIHLIDERSGAGGGIHVHGNDVAAVGDSHGEVGVGGGIARGGEADGNLRGRDNGPGSSPGVEGAGVIPGGIG